MIESRPQRTKQSVGDASARQIEVVHFQRGPVPGGWSVERIFDDVRRGLPDDITIKIVIARHPNSGFFPRLRNAIDAWRNRGQVNHVLGDTQYLAWFLPRKRSMISVLDCVSLERLTGWRRWIFWLFGYWWPLKRASRISTLSEFTSRHLDRWVSYPADRITVIPPPISEEFAYRPARPHTQWRRLLHIGMMPNKNLLRVIDAIDGMEVTLVTIGHLPDEYRTRLEEADIDYENHFDLTREELVQSYADADVLVFASTYEGFGMPIIEAQTVGRPVVTSNLASMPEASGGAACLIDPFDVESIRAGISKVLSDSEYSEKLIEDGRRNAQEYSAYAVAEKYAEMYRCIAAASK